MKLKILIAVIVTSALLGIIATVSKASNTVELQQVDLKTKQQEIEIKTKKSEELQIQLENAHGDLKKLKSIEEENKKLQEDIKKLQAKKAEEKRLAEAKKKSLAEQAVNAVTRTQTAYASSCGDAKSCIYHHESGNNPNAVNSIGCRGLGQACPGTKLPCGNDYACQDAWFTQYMKDRYGTWENAWAVWQNNHWW